MPSVCSRSLCAAVATWLLLGAAPAAAQPARPQLLVLQSFNSGNLPLDSFSSNFRIDLEARAGTPVTIVQFVIGPRGFVAAAEQALVDYIRATFANGPAPDLIVTMGGPAATFARKHRPQIFPETPLLLASVDQQYLRDPPLGDKETAVAAVNDFPELVDDILQLLPETRQCSRWSGLDRWAASGVESSRTSSRVFRIG